MKSIENVSAKYTDFFGGIITVTYKPAPILSRYIKQYNFFKSQNSSFTFFTPIPNGSLELLIHLGNNSLIIQNSSSTRYHSNFVVGLYELDCKAKVKPVSLENCYRGICIKFSYEGIRTLLGIRISDSLNKAISMQDLYGSKGLHLCNLLENEPDLVKRCNLMDWFFLDILSSKNLKNNKLSIINNYLQKTEGKISVADLAEKSNMSYRSLHRCFKEEIGICPKEYLKIVRFNKVCSRLRLFPYIHFPDILYSSGYYDQAHFIHDFKSIMKLSPLEFLKKCKGNFYLTRPFVIEDTELTKV